MASEFRLDNRVAIITGAGASLGRSHALLMASRGAKVGVNDLGGRVDGSGASPNIMNVVTIALLLRVGPLYPDL